MPAVDKQLTHTTITYSSICLFICSPPPPFPVLFYLVFLISLFLFPFFFLNSYYVFRPFFLRCQSPSETPEVQLKLPATFSSSRHVFLSTSRHAKPEPYHTGTNKSRCSQYIVYVHVQSTSQLNNRITIVSEGGDHGDGHSILNQQPTMKVTR